MCAKKPQVIARNCTTFRIVINLVLEVIVAPETMLTGGQFPALAI
jgi:hypothetical protein